MGEFILNLVEQGGYVGIALLMALENIIPPIPSELIMGLGGVMVARGVMEFWPLLLAGTIGTTAGNYWWFWLGDKWGYRRLRPFVARWGRWLTFDWQHVEQCNRFFLHYGHWVVFVMRFSPFLRTMISLPAGLMHMPHWKFLMFTFGGAAIWNVILIIGAQWLAGLIGRYENAMGWIVAGGVVLTIAAYLYRVFTWRPRPDVAE